MIKKEKSLRLMAPALGLMLLFLLTACSPNERLVYGDSVSSGETIENNLALSGTNINVQGDVAGDVFAAGQNITIDGNIGGSLYVVGETIRVNGELGGNIYAAGVNLELGEDSAVAKSVHFAGVRLSTATGSSIAWDLIAVSLGANLAGEVGRTTRATIGVVELANIILEQLNTQFDLPDVPQLFPRSGGYVPFEATWMGAAFGAVQLAGFEALSPSPPAQEVDAEVVLDTLVSRLKELAIMLLIGGLLIWLLPNRFLLWTNEGRQHPYASTGYGFVISIVGFFGFGVIALLLLALVIGIIVAGFWQQALLFALLSYSGLGFLYGIFLLFVYYISRLIFSYLLGWLIINRLNPSGNRYRFLTLLLGLLIYEIVRAIPYLGIVVAVLVTFFGLGAAWMAFLKIRRGELSADEPPKALAPPPEEPQNEPDDDSAAGKPDAAEDAEQLAEEGSDSTEEAEAQAEAEEEDEKPAPRKTRRTTKKS